MQEHLYAHTLADVGPENWERLETHLKNVAALAKSFASAWAAEEWGELAGRWHDLGKYSAEFQAYLFNENGVEAHLEQYKGRVDHSTAGAQHAVRVFTDLNQPEAGRLLAYCIAGHHAGLADADSPPGSGVSGLNQRLSRPIPDHSAAPADILSASKLSLPSLTLSHGDPQRAAFQISLFCRMLFSCLVDADFLATEAFASPDKRWQRNQVLPSLTDLERELDARLMKFVNKKFANKSDHNDTVYECRQEILAACRNAAEHQPGLFSLTVPTGGGKTYSYNLQSKRRKSSMNKYSVQLEIAGPAAIFARPDTGGTPTSYPVPTWSAAKGIFESIAFLCSGDACIMPEKVEVCRRVGDSGGAVRFQRYTTNYGGPLRKADLFRKGVASGGSSMQLFATILTDVCFRLHGTVIGLRRSGRINACHYLQDLFNRRLRQGRCFRTPCLGWSEFTCSYWGAFRSRTNPDGSDNAAWKARCERFGQPFEDLTEVDDALNLEIPSMLLSMWSSPTSGQYAPKFRQDVRIESGVLRYPFSASDLEQQEASHAE